jgi:monodehydroascorbate reductase (NADH)
MGGGNATGYTARTFIEHGMADGRLCIVSKEVLRIAHQLIT